MRVPDLAVPKSLGKIEGRFAGTSDRWIILIQDIHAHLTAQENIAALTDHLNQLYGIETFALEGGWSKTKLLKSNHLPNSRAKQQLARTLLEDAYLTGTAYSGIFSPEPLKLVGMENKKLYLQNRSAFLAHEQNRAAAAEKIALWEKEINDLKNQTYPPEKLTFDQKLTAFTEGRDNGEFLPFLIQSAQKAGVDLTDLDQITLFSELLKAQASVNSEKLESEAQRLMKFAPDPRLSFEEILRSGQIAESQLARYPETLKFREMLTLQDAISHHAFFNQIETTLQRFKDKEFQDPEEKKLNARSERFLLAKKMMLLHAAPADIKNASEQIDLLRADVKTAGLEEFFNQSSLFYKFARNRDAVFFKNIVSQPLLAGNIAVVAGGFHTEGITTRLEKEGISYLIITPSLGEDAAPPDEKLYSQRMSETLFPVNPQTQTLAPFAFFLRGIFDKKAFEEGVKTVEQTRNVKEGEKTILEWMTGKKQNEKAGAVTAEALSIKDFMALPEEEQKAQVEKWLDETKQTKIPVTVGIRTSTLRKLLQSEAGWTYWKNYIIPDRLLTLGEFQDSENFLVEPFIGIRKQPLRIKMPESNVLGPEEIARLRRNGKETSAALIDGSYADGDKTLLVLPPLPASLMTARLLLENKISGTITPEFLEKIEGFLTEIFTAQGILEKAA